MAVIRCDYCAARLSSDDERCPKCGHDNAEYRGRTTATGKSTGKALRIITGLAVLCALAFLIVLKLTPINSPSLQPWAYSLRELLFRPKYMVKDTVATYVDAWMQREGSQMSSLVGEGGMSDLVVRGRLHDYLLPLRSYKMGRTVISGNKARVSTTLTVASLGSAADSLVKGATTLSQALEKGPDEYCTIVFGLTREDGTWKMVEGTDPTCDEILEPIVLSSSPQGKLPDRLSDRLPKMREDWETYIDTTAVNIKRLDSLKVIQLTGAIENKDEEPLGPLEICVTYYDAQNTEIGKSYTYIASIPSESLLPFEAYFREIGSLEVRRYALTLKSLY